SGDLSPDQRLAAVRDPRDPLRASGPLEGSCRQAARREYRVAAVRALSRPSVRIGAVLGLPRRSRTQQFREHSKLFLTKSRADLIRTACVRISRHLVVVANATPGTQSYVRSARVAASSSGGVDGGWSPYSPRKRGAAKAAGFDS